MDGYLPVFMTLLEFLPIVVLLLCAIGLFENCGWIMCFGCNTLGVSTMNRNDDKRMLNFMTFLPCSAKLPVMVFLLTMILGITVFGIVFVYVLCCFIGLLLGGNASIKCPRFQRFTVQSFILMVLRNIRIFLGRISVGLVLAVTILYSLQYIGLLDNIARVIMPIFLPLGFDSVAIVVALLFGLIAKEMIVGVLVGFGIATMSVASGLALCVFAILYTPCLPTLLAVKKRFGGWQMAKTAGLHFMVAWVCAWVVYSVLIWM